MIATLALAIALSLKRNHSHPQLQRSPHASLVPPTDGWISELGGILQLTLPEKERYCTLFTKHSIKDSSCVASLEAFLSADSTSLARATLRKPQNSWDCLLRHVWLSGVIGNMSLSCHFLHYCKKQSLPKMDNPSSVKLLNCKICLYVSYGLFLFIVRARTAEDVFFVHGFKFPDLVALILWLRFSFFQQYVFELPRATAHYESSNLSPALQQF